MFCNCSGLLTVYYYPGVQYTCAYVLTCWIVAGISFGYGQKGIVRSNAASCFLSLTLSTTARCLN